MMKKSSTVAGIALAFAAASIMSMGTVSAAPSSDTAMVKCSGVNACKGHNDCKTANNACKGHGSCKGNGFVMMSANACDKIGGKVSK